MLLNKNFLVSVVKITLFVLISAFTNVIFSQTDTDGDGVSNIIDEDDDNDGILDTVECSSFIDNGTTDGVTFTMDLVTSVTPSGTSTELVTSATTDYVNSQGNGNPPDGLEYLNGWDQNPGETYAVVDVVDIPVNGASTVDFSYYYYSYAPSDATSYNPTTPITLYYDNGGSSSTNYTFSSADISTLGSGGWVLISGTFSVPAGANNITGFRVRSENHTNSNTTIVGSPFNTDREVFAVAPAEFEVPNLICATDTDGDGIVDSEDPDSDGDGCLDADEAF